jgi:hypothetical protein
MPTRKQKGTMSNEHDNIEKFSIRLLVQSSIISALVANSENKKDIARTFDLLKKDLLSYLKGVGASEEILRYAERQTGDYENLLRWDGISPRPPVH